MSGCFARPEWRTKRRWLLRLHLARDGPGLLHDELVHHAAPHVPERVTGEDGPDEHTGEEDEEEDDGQRVEGAVHHERQPALLEQEIERRTKQREQVVPKRHYNLPCVVVSLWWIPKC